MAKTRQIWSPLSNLSFRDRHLDLAESDSVAVDPLLLVDQAPLDLLALLAILEAFLEVGEAES
jgi:hypothetical protein